MISLLLFYLQFSVAITMPFPYRGSNSEEAQPYGPYNRLQMPHVGAMYGFGLPHYSQMIQMQQALSRQPAPWLPHLPQNKETAPPQMPQSPIKQQFPQLPSLPLPQPNPNYQHVTKQPLQLPPAPESQAPQMFPQFLNPINPFWPQGNYFGYFGFGGRPPYNSEEANEDEEAPKEKDPPKAEPPVTESSNTSTVETNSTIVDHAQGNNTAQNESLAGEIQHAPNVVMSGPNISPPGEHMIPSIHGRHGSIIHGPPRPSHHIIRIPNRENLPPNFQQRYYTVTRVLGGRGDHPSSTYPSNYLINKADSTPHLPVDKRVINGGTQFTHVDRVSGRPTSQPVNAFRGIFNDPKLSVSRTEHSQKHNGYNTGVHGDFPKVVDHSQPREHPNLQVNRNIVPDHNIIIVHPQRNERISEYSRYPIVEERKPNIPSGIFSSHHHEQYQPKQSETSQRSNIYDFKGTHVNHNSDIPARNEDPYAPRGAFDSGSTWNNRYISVGAGESGQPPEMIYLMSSLPSDIDAVHGYSNQKQNQQEYTPDLKESPQYVTDQRGANIYTEDDLKTNEFKTSTSPQSENQLWQANDFATAQSENLKPQPYRRLGPSRNLQIEQGKKELYTEGRYPNNQKRFFFISKPNIPKTQEQINFSGIELPPQFREPSSPKLADTLDHTGYYTDYETNPQTLGKNTQTIGSRPYDPVENVQIANRDEIHVRESRPINLQILTLPEAQPWGYNPQEIPSQQRQYNNYDSYPSNMKVHLPYQREMKREHGGQQYYMCTLPFVGDDTGRGITNSLLYLCCKLAQVDQGSPSVTADNIPEFRLTLKEYNDFIPQRDRTHRQHTRNVGDPPKTVNNQPNNSVLSNCNASNTPENAQFFRSEPGGTPCATKACDDQNLEHPHEGFNNFATVPCGTRGDNYLSPKQEEMNSQKKIFHGREKTETLQIHVQDDGSRHGENNMKTSKGTGQLLQILTCPQDRQMHEADTPANLDNRNKIDVFSLRHEISNREPGINKQDGSSVLQLAESDPVNNAPDCLILKK